MNGWMDEGNGGEGGLKHFTHRFPNFITGFSVM